MSLYTQAVGPGLPLRPPTASAQLWGHPAGRGHSRWCLLLSAAQPVLPVVWGHCARLWRCVGSDHCAPGWTVMWGGAIDCEVVCVGGPL